MVHAIPLDLSAVRNAARQDDVSSWDGPVVGELDNLPDGEQTYWGIPFELGASDATKSWIRLSKMELPYRLAAAASRILSLRTSVTQNQVYQRIPE